MAERQRRTASVLRVPEPLVRVRVPRCDALAAAWRLLTAAVFHAGLLHVAFNMMAFVPVGASLECSLGTVPFAHLVALLLALGGAAFVFFSFVAAFGPAGCRRR